MLETGTAGTATGTSPWPIVSPLHFSVTTSGPAGRATLYRVSISILILPAGRGLFARICVR